MIHDRHQTSIVDATLPDVYNDIPRIRDVTSFPLSRFGPLIDEKIRQDAGRASPCSSLVIMVQWLQHNLNLVLLGFPTLGVREGFL